MNFKKIFVLFLSLFLTLNMAVFSKTKKEKDVKETKVKVEKQVKKENKTKVDKKAKEDAKVAKKEAKAADKKAKELEKQAKKDEKIKAKEEEKVKEKAEKPSKEKQQKKEKVEKENVVSQRKPVIITFTQPKCSDCKNQEIILNEIKTQYANSIDFVEINITDEDCDYKNLQTKYNITSAPTTLFLNSNTNLTKKVSEYIPQELYLKHIKQVLN